MKHSERIAHDLICIIKYGSIGGSVRVNEINKLVDYMERIGLVQRAPGSNPPAPRVPKPAPPPNPPAITIPKINGLPVPSVQLPSIRLP